MIPSWMRVAADLVHEELQGVRGGVCEVAVDVRRRRRRLARAVVLEIDAAALDLLVDLLHLLVLEVERLGDLVDLGILDAAAFLPTIEQGLHCSVHMSRISVHGRTKQRCRTDSNGSRYERMFYTGAWPALSTSKTSARPR